MKKMMFFLMFLTISLYANAQNYKLTGNLGEDKASMTLKKSGNRVKGTVVRCDHCLPIKVEGSWKNDSIKVAGYSEAGSYIQYELFVTDNTVQGQEILSAEGEQDKTNISMSITKTASIKKPKRKANR